MCRDKLASGTHQPGLRMCIAAYFLPSCSEPAAMRHKKQQTRACAQRGGTRTHPAGSLGHLHTYSLSTEHVLTCFVFCFRLFKPEPRPTEPTAQYVQSHTADYRNLQLSIQRHIQHIQSTRCVLETDLYAISCAAAAGYDPATGRQSLMTRWAPLKHHR